MSGKKKHDDVADEFTDIGPIRTVFEDSEVIKKRVGRIWTSFYRKIL